VTNAVEDFGSLPHASQVEAMAGLGLSPMEIAQLLRVELAVVKTNYANELADGHIKANAKVAQSLFRIATSHGREAVSAAIFWLKARANWKETSVHEHAGSQGQPLQRADEVRVTIVEGKDPYGPMVTVLREPTDEHQASKSGQRQWG
jgi:hypothetical protein